MVSIETYSPEPIAAVPPPPPPPGAADFVAPEETTYRLHRRFDRLGRLYGDAAVERLMGARVAIFGLGGVGGWAAESLARSAIGHLTLVDFDDVCITNSNRQIQAMRGGVGKPKATLLAERLQNINPSAKIEAKRAFYKAENADEMLTPPWGEGDYDFVIDAIDNLTAKAHLIATCHARGIPVIASMGAAGKMDPTRIRKSDLADTQVCRLARDLRKLLRKNHGFPAKGPMGVQAVWSDEARAWPKALSYDGGKGFKCVCPHRSPEHGCDSRALIDGTASFVTGSFGLACASHVINTLCAPLIADAEAGMDRFGRTPEQPAAAE